MKISEARRFSSLKRKKSGFTADIIHSYRPHFNQKSWSELYFLSYFAALAAIFIYARKGVLHLQRKLFFIYGVSRSSCLPQASFSSLNEKQAKRLDMRPRFILFLMKGRLRGMKNGCAVGEELRPCGRSGWMGRGKEKPRLVLDGTVRG